MKKSGYYLMGFIAYFIWGLTFPFGKLVIPPLSSYTFVFLRTSMGVILLIIYIAFKGEIKNWFHSLTSNFWILFFFTLIPFTFSYVLQFYALEFTSPINQSILAQTSIIWVILINYLVFHTVPNKKFMIAVVIGIGGIFLLITNKGWTLSTETLKGDLLSILAFISWASYSSFSKPLSKKMKPLYSIASILLFSTFFLVGIAYITGMPEQLSQLDGVQWGIMLYLGFVCTGLAYVLHLFGISGEGVKTEYMVYLGFIMPIVSTFYSIMFLDAIITWRILFGALLIIFSVILVQNRHRNAKENEFP
ncbi:MAG: DMT family transporter [Promethearchaeota archaeon]